MHVLHRPHLPRAVTITMIAALLAIAITLILATAVRGLASSSSGSSALSASVPAVHNQTAATTWQLNPFTPVLRKQFVAPWTDHTPFRAG